VPIAHDRVDQPERLEESDEQLLVLGRLAPMQTRPLRPAGPKPSR